MAITGYSAGVLHFGAATDAYGDQVLLKEIVVQWDTNGVAGNVIEFSDASSGGNAIATFKNTNGAWESQREDFGGHTFFAKDLVLTTATNMDHNDVYLA